MMTRVAFIISVFSSSLFAAFTFSRDPFQPFHPSRPTQTVATLQGIIDGVDKSYGIVLYKGEKRVLSAGDRVGDYHVESVSNYKILLKGPDKTLILKVGKEAQL